MHMAVTKTEMGWCHLIIPSASKIEEKALNAECRALRDPAPATVGASVPLVLCCTTLDRSQLTETLSYYLVLWFCSYSCPACNISSSQPSPYLSTPKKLLVISQNSVYTLFLYKKLLVSSLSYFL